MKQPITLAIIVGSLFGIIVMMILAAIMEQETAHDEELALYCEMVSIRKETRDHTLGWPDYKGIYDEACLDNELLPKHDTRNN